MDVSYPAKAADRSIYDQHIAVTAHEMDMAHTDAGAETLSCAQGFGSLGIGVLNYNRLLPGPLSSVMRRCLEIPQALLTAPLWLLQTKLESDAFSPFLIGVYRRSDT